MSRPPRPAPAGRIAVGLIAALLLAAIAAAGWQGYRSWQDQRSRLARLEPGPVDIGFAQFMSLHHQQAIGMAQIMVDRKPVGLAHAMAYAQLEELGQMRGWLLLWEKPLQPATRSMDWMLLGSTPPDAELSRYLLDCQRSPTGMPGLATPEELNRLRQLQGTARDRLFLTLMLAHHEGGIPMARFAAEQARLPVVRQLATRIVMDQAQETMRMRIMLQVLDEADATARAAWPRQPTE